MFKISAFSLFAMLATDIKNHYEAGGEKHPVLDAVLDGATNVVAALPAEDTDGQAVQAAWDKTWPVVESLLPPTALTPALVVIGNAFGSLLGKAVDKSENAIGTAIANAQATEKDPGNAQSLPADAPKAAAWPKSVPNT